MVNLVEDFSIHLRMKQLMDVEVVLPGAPNCKVTGLIQFTGLIHLTVDPWVVAHALSTLKLKSAKEASVVVPTKKQQPTTNKF